MHHRYKMNNTLNLVQMQRCADFLLILQNLSLSLVLSERMCLLYFWSYRMVVRVPICVFECLYVCMRERERGRDVLELSKVCSTQLSKVAFRPRHLIKMWITNPLSGASEYTNSIQPNMQYILSLSLHPSQPPLVPAAAAMAVTFASSTTVVIPSFAGLKAEAPKVVCMKSCSTAASRAKGVGIKASILKQVGSAAVVVATTGMLLAGNAMAIVVNLGDDTGGLVFEPSEFTVAPGEKITFKNKSGYPHNVVFDGDEVPSGVNADQISMPEDALLNGPGDVFEVALEAKGEYSFYCAPHQGAGMVGKVTVN